MEQLQRHQLYSLEDYATIRDSCRADVMAHKPLRQLQLGPNVRLLFEDRKTMHYQIQEMLRIERIFEAEGIQEELDAYNPLEAKASLNVIELRKEYGHQLGFCGNSNIQVWESNDRDLIRREVLRKLNAARGGGYIFQSDHSVSSSVSGETYDYIVNLVREFGHYPLDLREFNMEI